MTPAERVLAYFDRISEAPDAIPRLRRFVLELAVRGKLSANTAGTQVLSIEGGEFDIPDTWSWQAIGDVADVNMGQSPSSEDYNQSGTGLPFYQGKADFGPRSPAPRYWCTKPTKVAQSNDVLISVRAPVGPTNVATEECCIGRGLAALRPHAVLDLEYFLVSLRAREPELAALGFGTTFAAVNKKQLLSFRIPVPPLAEQHRIVAKVDELMALCDRLEASQKERDRRRDLLVSASVARLSEPPNASALRADARFWLQQFQDLVRRATHVHTLRESIRDLAVLGHLEEQDLDDEPVLHLIERLQRDAAKRRLKSAGASGHPSAQPVPATWRTVALGDICRLVTSGSRGWAEYYSASGAKFIRAQNIRFGTLRLDNLAHVTPPATAEGDRTRVECGDILIVITGAGVTNPALVDHDPSEAYVSQHVALVRPTDATVSPWILLCLMAPQGARKTLVERAYGAGKPGLNLETIRALRIPMPPRDEQDRVLSKVRILMAICDRLEAQLEAGRAAQAALLEATLREALGSAQTVS